MAPRFARRRERSGPAAWAGSRRAWPPVPRQRSRGPRGWRRPDSEILDELCERIVRGGVDASRVELRVEDGEVSLDGVVASVAELAALLELPDAVLGVTAVRGDLHLVRAGDEERVEPDPETRH